MSDNDNDTFITPTEAANRLSVAPRTIERWAASGKIRTIPNPRNRRAKLYNLHDLIRWGLGGVEPEHLQQPAPPAPSTELVPQSDLLRMLAETQDKLNAAMHEAGRLRGQLEAQQKLLEDREQQRAADQAELERLQHEVARLRRPWWLWWLRRE